MSNAFDASNRRPTSATLLDRQYTDPRLVSIYDALNTGTQEADFYAARVGPSSQRILDLGCGTGSSTIRLAELGHTVIGIDPSAEMLRVGRQRTGGERVTWIEGDLSALAEDMRFDAILMMGHAFQCLRDGRHLAALLRDSRRHLVDRGRLMFETRNPYARPWEQWTLARSRRVIDVAPWGQVEVMHSLEGIGDDHVTFTTCYTFGGTGEVFKNRSTLWFPTQSTIADALAYAGFNDVAWYGDWLGDPFDPDSPEIITVAGFRNSPPR